MDESDHCSFFEIVTVSIVDVLAVSTVAVKRIETQSD